MIDSVLKSREAVFAKHMLLTVAVTIPECGPAATRT